MHQQVQTTKPRMGGLIERNCAYLCQGFGAAAALGRGLPAAAAPGLDDRTLGHHNGYTLGAVSMLLSYIPREK